MELVTVMEKAGGNGPLMAQGASGLGAKVTCLGLLGYPEILPVFKPLADKAELLSIGQPGHTDALEFQDGKVMLGKLTPLIDMNWQRMLDVLGEDKIKALLSSSDLVGCTNWTMLTEMPGIFDGLAEVLSKDANPPIFFFDLADPQKRAKQDIEGVLSQIKRFDNLGGAVLGLNLKEAEQIADILGVGSLLKTRLKTFERLQSLLAKNLKFVI